jgi:hypothetical protein
MKSPKLPPSNHDGNCTLINTDTVNQENLINGNEQKPSPQAKHSPQATNAFRLPLQEHHIRFEANSSDDCHSQGALPSTAKERSTNQEVDNLDMTNEMALRRMEEVMVMWYYKITEMIDISESESSESDPSFKEYINILQFCAASLNNTITSGNIPKVEPDQTKPQWQQPLPPFGDLPCMIETLRYWYLRHVSMYRHRSMGNQHVSVEEYVTKCDNRMKQWLTGSTSELPKIDPTSPKQAIELEDCNLTRKKARPSDLGDCQFRWSGIILNMYHASKCPFKDSTSIILAARSCTVMSGCEAVKNLYWHLSSNSCHPKDCKYGSLCAEAKEAIRHYEQCQSESCTICGPVLRHIPCMKEAIKRAIGKSQQEVQLLTQAQRTLMKEVTAMYKSSINTTTRAKPTSSRYLQSSSTSSSPLAQCSTIGTLKRCDSSSDSIDMIVRGSPKKRRHYSSSKCNIY